MTRNLFTHSDLHKPNNKLVNAQFGHCWCYDEPRANSDSQDSPLPRLKGSHHLPLYNILCVSPWGPHLNGILSQDSQVGIMEFPQLGLPQLWGPIILCANFRLMRFKVKLQPSLRAFQCYVAHHLRARKSGRFLTFSG